MQIDRSEIIEISNPRLLKIDTSLSPNGMMITGMSKPLAKMVKQFFNSNRYEQDAPHSIIYHQLSKLKCYSKKWLFDSLDFDRFFYMEFEEDYDFGEDEPLGHHHLCVDAIYKGRDNKENRDLYCKLRCHFVITCSSRTKTNSFDVYARLSGQKAVTLIKHPDTYQKTKQDSERVLHLSQG